MAAITGKLTGPQKTAILILALGDAFASDVFKKFDRSEITAVSRAMAKLGTDKAALLTRIALKQRITSMTDKLTAAEKRRSGRKNDGWN